MGVLEEGEGAVLIAIASCYCITDDSCMERTELSPVFFLPGVRCAMVDRQSGFIQCVYHHVKRPKQSAVGEHLSTTSNFARSV